MTDTPDLPPLDNCPFCGSTMHTKAGMGCWYAHCSSCWAEGPLRDTEAEAIEAANRRASRAGAAVPPGLPEGFLLLPIEATDSMMDADWDVSMSDAHSSGGVSAAAWRAMVEAAPQVTFGTGHSGLGWYMHDTEYPEEGAVFLSAATGSPASATGNSDQKDAQP